MHANMLILICAIALINSEQNLLAPNLSAMSAAFNFTSAEKDLAAGGLALSLFLVGAPAALLIGAAADGSARRVSLLVLVLLIGAVGCMGSCLVRTEAVSSNHGPLRRPSTQHAASHHVTQVTQPRMS